MDYKVVLFSLLYILTNACMISILRKYELDMSIGSVVFFPLSIAITLLGVFGKKWSKEIFSRKKKWKFSWERVGTIFELVVTIGITMMVVCVRINPFITHEQEMQSRTKSFTDGYTELEGYVYDEPVEKHTSQQLTVKMLQGASVEGLDLSPEDSFILIKTSSFFKFHIGETCWFRGTIEVPENFEEFDYRGYLRDKKIFFLMNNPIIECRDITEGRKGNIVRNALVDSKNHLISIIDQVLNEPQSSLLAGIIFGQKRLFSNTFDEGTRVAGLSHIVAASGYNVTILVIAIERLLFFLPKKWRTIGSLIVIWLFAILSGLSSSIVRACIMGSISLLSIIFGRSNAVHVAIPLASAIFVVIKPLVVFDIGFLLSISAVLGLTYLLPILVELKQKHIKKAQYIENNILPTLSCTLATLPVSIMTFSTFSIWAVPSNTIILPIIDTTMFLGIFGIVLWNIFKPLSYILFTIVNMQLKYFEFVVNGIYSLNWGQFELSESLSKNVSLLSLFLMLIFTIYLYPIKNEKYNYYLKPNS